MKFKFWGVRGSIATPGPKTVKYGGNTTCIEIRTSTNDLLILDAGTGIFALAQTLTGRTPLVAHILITHTHWDHIQGLPFFLPMLTAANQIHLYGGMDPVTQQGIERALTVQLQYSFFPISESQVKAKLCYHTLCPGQTIQIGSARVTPTVLNHPVLNFGYRVDDSDGSSLFFTGDYEPPINPYAPVDPSYESNQQFVEAKLREVKDAMRDVDALIIDSPYTDDEYPKKIGWGHSTYGIALRLAQDVGAKKLFITHHEPGRSDADLEALFTDALAKAGQLTCEVLLAQEGVEHNLR
jgi:phosphoribosyl 1,2-cyclic phosphodiesterase